MPGTAASPPIAARSCFRLTIERRGRLATIADSGSLPRCEQVEHERHARERVAHPADPRQDDAAVALAADDAVVGLERRDHVRLADRGADDRGPRELRGDRVDQAARREIRRGDAGTEAFEGSQRREGERVLLADEDASLVDDREAVRVGILREADRRAMRTRRLGKPAEVLFERFGRVGEDARWIAMDLMDRDAEGVEQDAAPREPEAFTESTAATSLAARIAPTSTHSSTRSTWKSVAASSRRMRGIEVGAA